jgi:putative transposase
MLRAYKTEIDVNNKQKTLLLQHLGCARKAFNWALNKKKEAFDTKTKIPNAIELHRELNQLKKIEFPWFYQSSKSAPQNALRDCDKAFANFFTRCKKKVKGKKGFPKFKSRKNPKQSFRLDGTIRVEANHIQLPRIGKIRLKETDYLPADQKILSATISRQANRWFVSIQVESPEREAKPANREALGIDLGIKTLATCSDGTTFENPKALRKNLKKLKRKQRQLSRKKKGSNNREKAKHNLAKLHYRIANIRRDCLHKITSSIVQKANVIVLEDLKIGNMLKNHHLAQAISDVGMSEFRRQIEYKAKWAGRTVVLAPTFFPSSKLDHKSGKVNRELKLSDRVIHHDDGSKTDRDLNAAINLENYYRQSIHTGSSSEIYASGDGSSSNANLISPSAKEEFNKKPTL